MSHKYIKEITKLEETPYGWDEDSNRASKWREERRIYGFDERETWSLDYTFFCWLYERLLMFKEVNHISLDFHTFNINGKELTHGQCIDKMIDNCKEIILTDDELPDLRNETLDIWKTCINAMWW